MKTTQLTIAKLGLVCLTLVLLSFVWNQNGDRLNEVNHEDVIAPLSFAGLNVQLEDTAFQVGHHSVKAYRAISEGGAGNKGITLAYGQYPKASMVEISLFDTVDYNSITLGLFNNSDPIIELLHEGEVVKKHSGDIEGGQTRVTLDVKGLKLDAIRVSSFEAILYWMRLE